MKANMAKPAVQIRFTASWDKYVKGIIQTRKLSSIYHISHVIVNKSIRLELQNIQRIISWHLLILLLVLPRCLGMWTSIQTHIYRHLSKARLLLKTNKGINEQCLQWVLYAQDHGRCFVAGVRNRPQGLHEGLIVCPLSWWYQEGGS